MRPTPETPTAPRAAPKAPAAHRGSRRPGSTPPKLLPAQPAAERAAGAPPWGPGGPGRVDAPSVRGPGSRRVVCKAEGLRSRDSPPRGLARRSCSASRGWLQGQLRGRQPASRSSVHQGILTGNLECTVLTR